MNKIKVHIKDKYTLVLDEDARAGDIIDLRELTNVDTSYLEKAIESQQDKTYNRKLDEAKALLKNEFEKEKAKIDLHYNQAFNSKTKSIEESYKETIDKLNNTINELNNKINELNNKNEFDVKQAKLEVDNSYKEQITKLNSEISELNKSKETTLELEKTKLINEYENKISHLNSELKSLKDNKDNEIKLAINNKENDFNNKLNSINFDHQKALNDLRNNLEKAYNEEINKLNIKIETNELDTLNKLKDKELELDKLHQEELNKKNDEYNELNKQFTLLQRQKAALNVKQIGEDLEHWCDNEYLQYAQSGFYNCTWSKDNKVVKDEGETKGSKADFVFRVYADDSKEELLTSVCLEMKDENPDSTNKKTNSDYYKTLDKNRNKKECKYALLVSNLETDNNLPPIYKVLEFPDMYVVRPAYMMMFLNIINSLTVSYQKLILTNIEERAKVKKELDFIEHFDKLKNTYLDKPLETLVKEVDGLTKIHENMSKEVGKLAISIDAINTKYINQILDKLTKFENEIAKEYRKLNK